MFTDTLPSEYTWTLPLRYVPLTEVVKVKVYVPHGVQIVVDSDAT